MPEKPENEARETDQNAEVSEDRTEQEHLPEATGYRESEDHVPDPTAMTGTLETSGTGGGRHTSLTGVTRIFGDVEDITRRVESLIGERIESLTAEVRSLLLQQEVAAQAESIPQQTVEDSGLPSNQGNIIAPQDSSGAAKDADRSGNVSAGSPDDVSTGDKHSEAKAEGDKTNAEKYVDTVLSGKTSPAKKTTPARRNTNNKQK